MKRFQTPILVLLGLLVLTIPVPRCGSSEGAQPHVLEAHGSAVISGFDVSAGAD
jgi:hypothetical protein